MSQYRSAIGQEPETGEVLGVLVDGNWCDPETGEVLGEALADQTGLTTEEAERAMARLLAAVVAKEGAARRRASVAELRAARLAEIERSDEALIALADRDANLVALEASAMKKVEFLAAAYREALADFARRELAGRKARTWKSEFGSLSLRRVNPRPSVVDHEAAAAWLESKECASPIERRVKVTLVPDSLIDEAMADPASGFGREPEREECDIKVAGTKL